MSADSGAGKMRGMSAYTPRGLARYAPSGRGKEKRMAPTIAELKTREAARIEALNLLYKCGSLGAGVRSFNKMGITEADLREMERLGLIECYSVGVMKVQYPVF